MRREAASDAASDSIAILASITLTMSAYVAISRGNYGLACAFSAILTVLTAIILLIYLRFTAEEDIQM